MKGHRCAHREPKGAFMRFVIGLMAAAIVAMTAGAAVSLAPSSPEQRPPTTTTAATAPHHDDHYQHHGRDHTGAGDRAVHIDLGAWHSGPHRAVHGGRANSYALVWIDVCWQRAAGHPSVRLITGTVG